MKKSNLLIRKILLIDIIYILFFISSIIYSFCFCHINTKSIYSGKEKEFTGIISSYDVKGDRLSFILDLKEPIKCNFYFKTEKEKIEFLNKIKLGSHVKIKGELSIPKNNTIPNNFNYKKYLNNMNIHYLFTTKKINLLDKKIGLLYKIKNTVINRINSFSKINDYLLTFIIGDKSLLNVEDFNNYRKNGVTHLFAISGMHIGLFSVSILFILKKLKIKETKRYLITILFIWFYAFLTGFSPSVLRAGLLFSLATINKIFYTEVKSINLLLLTGTILIFHNPRIIYNIGFIYSFLTTFGLIFGSAVINKHKLIGTSLVAMFFSLPVTINNFYEFNIISIFLNIIFVPIVSNIVYPLCLITFIFRFLEPITDMVLNMLELLNTFCANIDFFHVIIPKMPNIILIIYYVILLLFLNKKFKTTVFILFTIIFSMKLKPYMDNTYHLLFLDIGQGDSTLIIMPRAKEVLLVDTGGKPYYKVDKWKLKPKFNISDGTINYLHSIGINRIDYMVITHGDIDHIGDSFNIISKIKVNKVILNRGEYNYTERKLISKNINRVNNYNGKMNFKILRTEIEGDENSNSIISLLNIFNTDILLMGDAPKKKELEIINKYSIPNIEILKLGHHGSNTSSDENFIRFINAKVGIISSGRKNKYGHPHKETIDTLKKLGLKYYNTQTSGTIEYIFSKNNTKIIEYKP